MRRDPIHPDIETLLGHWDGSLPPARSEAVAAHLNACHLCRLEYHRLNTTWSAAHRQRPAVDVPGPSGLAACLAGIHAWEARRSSQGKSPAAVKQEVKKEIEPYLGRQAARRILETVPHDGQNLLSAIEPVLAIFLGCRAASHLVSHVVDAAIVRI